MRTANTMVRFLLVLLVIAVIGGCAGSRTSESTGEYVDDSAITAKVKADILGDPSLKVFQVSVETYKSVVQLSGFVDSPQAVSRAGEVASRVSGVKSVTNNLIVK
jgi:osmotically-inducible protein OsmY